MFKFVKTAALSALIGLSAFAAMPSAANAQSGGVYLGFGNSGPGVGFHFDDRGRNDYRGRDDRGYRDDRRGPPREHYRGCSPREAVRKASRMGLRDVRVVRDGRRVVEVEGRRHGPRYYTVAFANERGCPTLR